MGEFGIALQSLSMDLYVQEVHVVVSWGLVDGDGRFGLYRSSSMSKFYSFKSSKTFSTSQRF